VNLVVPKDALMSTAMQWSEKFASKGRISMAVAKKVMAKGLTFDSVEEAVAYEENEWVKLFDTKDQKEGMRAFVEKRKPSFTGD